MKSTIPIMYLITQIRAKIKNITHLKERIPNPLPIFIQIYNDMRRVQIHILMGMVILAGLTLVGCQGCGSGKETVINTKSDTLTVPKETSIPIQNTGGELQYPYTDEETGYTHLSYSTFMYKEALFKENTNDNFYVKFKNGFEVDGIKDAPIVRDLQKEAISFGTSFVGLNELDMTRISEGKRKALFGKMKLKPGVKFSEFFTIEFFSEIVRTKNFIIIYTILTPYAKINGFNNATEVVGSINQVEIYNYEGKLVNNINLDEYGGRLHPHNKEKTIIVYSEPSGYDGGFECDFKPVLIQILDFKNGNVIHKLNMPCNFLQILLGNTENYKFKIDNGNDKITCGIINPFKETVQYKIFSREEYTKFEDVWSSIDLNPEDNIKLDFTLVNFEEWNKLDLTIFEEEDY